MNMPRINRPIHATIPPEILARLDAWIAAQTAPPKRATVIALAISRFLDAEEKARED